MRKRLLLTLLIVPLSCGCVVGGVTPLFSEPLPTCDEAENHVDCILPRERAKVDEIRSTTQNYPEVGLAMSGGGSKAAPFAMGVLKRFIDGDDPWIFRTDYLSSVSGSGYSAFFMYHAAYLLAKGDITPDPDFPGLTRFFVDARNLNSSKGAPYFVEMRSLDLKGRNDVVSLAEANGGKACEQLTVQNYAPFPANRVTPLYSGIHEALYQGWVECYQDLLMTRRAPDSQSHVVRGSLVTTFAELYGESAAAAPMHYFANLLFDWRKRLSPSQYHYLYGIERTYGYLPEAGTQLPTSLQDRRFKVMSNCFQFKDLSLIYTMDPRQTSDRIGGYLPKWILQATGASGNVGLELSEKAYDLNTDVFEITFDEFGSGRYGYVRGSPALVGLTVPLALLSSAAFADTAQRSLRYPRAAVNALLQTLNVRWGLDIANYNTSEISRYKHSLLIWPFYFLDDPPTTQKGPTIHLSDGGQSGDNLGMVSLLRRSVRNIVVANGENDWHRDARTDGYMSLASLCSVNYYLIQHGYTLVFESDPREPGMSHGTAFDLSEKCKWDAKARFISIPPVNATSDNPLRDEANITPFNWRRRVWVGHVQALPAGRTEELTIDHIGPMPASLSPEHLEGINVYYLMAALDKDEWFRISQEWYNRKHPKGKKGSPFVCNGYTEENGLRYPCGLVEYIHNNITSPDDDNLDDDGRISAEKNRKWVSPQNSTAFTTYSNSVYLFRAYRDLGWAYADALTEAAPDLVAIISKRKNTRPLGYDVLYNAEASGASKYAATAETAVCRQATLQRSDTLVIEHH
jgi:hypothetical protein